MKNILPLVFSAIAVEHDAVDRGRPLFDFAPMAVGMTRELFDQIEAEAEASTQIVNPMHATSDEKTEIMGLPVLIIPGSGRKLYMMRELFLFLDDQEGDE